MTDSESLRSTFYSSSKDDIADGWEILAEGDDGDYGHDLWMLLKGPDGKYYEQSASCCSCYGIEDQWSPVETNLTAIEAMIAQHMKGYPGDTEEEVASYSYNQKFKAWREARDILKAESK